MPVLPAGDVVSGFLEGMAKGLVVFGKANTPTVETSSNAADKSAPKPGSLAELRAREAAIDALLYSAVSSALFPMRVAA